MQVVVVVVEVEVVVVVGTAVASIAVGVVVTDVANMAVGVVVCAVGVVVEIEVGRDSFQFSKFELFCLFFLLCCLFIVLFTRDTLKAQESKRSRKKAKTGV